MGNFLTSIKFLFLKKLSTGFDEEMFHRKQILGLQELIKGREFEVNKMKEELKLLKDNREKDNLRKKEEIENLKNELEKLENDRKKKIEESKKQSKNMRNKVKKRHDERVINNS